MTINGRQPTNYTTFEVLFLPCNVVNFWDKEPDPIADECVPDLEAQQAFLGPLQLLFYFNHEQFDDQAYGDESIVRESKVMNVQVDTQKQTWQDFTIQTTELNDETAVVQLGNAQQSYFYGQNEKPVLIPSAWNKFPTEQSPKSKYKYTSLEITVNPDLKQINRKTYSTLDLLGDVGGFGDALLVLG